MSIFKAHIDLMSPYLPPLEGRDPERFDLLDFNERTTPVSELIVKDIVAWIESGRLQMYPSYGDIEEKIADYCGVSSANLMITNGSDQGIDLIFRSKCEPGDEVIIPEPSFAMYFQCAQIENTRIHSPQYTIEKGYPLEECLSLINENTKVVVVSNPNNPCATSVSRELILTLAKAAPNAVILVDECYFEYTKISVTDLVEQYPNILVTRTFSKTWGMPSLRIGYVVAAEENICALLKVRGPYDINQVAVVAVRSALRHQETIDVYIDEVMMHSKPKLESYLDENKINYWPSSANFIWVFFENAELMEEKLRNAGVLVRPKAAAGGRLGLRITIGTLKQTEHLISVLKERV